MGNVLTAPKRKLGIPSNKELQQKAIVHHTTFKKETNDAALDLYKRGFDGVKEDIADYGVEGLDEYSWMIKTLSLRLSRARRELRDEAEMEASGAKRRAAVVDGPWFVRVYVKYAHTPQDTNPRDRRMDYFVVQYTTLANAEDDDENNDPPSYYGAVTQLAIEKHARDGEEIYISGVGLAEGYSRNPYGQQSADYVSTN